MNPLNKCVSVIMAGVIILSCGGVTAAERENSSNLLINGNCEENFLGTTGWRFRDKGGWFIESGFENGLISDNQAEGKSAMYFHSATVAQRVTLERNKTYVISFYLKCDEDKEINFDFCDGAQDWPASYSVMHEKVAASSEWQKHTYEFECGNTQDYLVSFNLWDEVNVYLDDITLREKDAYVSRLITGVNGKGEISYSADTVGEGVFTAALYDSANNLIAVKTKNEKGTFPPVNGYGGYAVKCYFLGNELAAKAQRVTYNENSVENSYNSLGAAEMLTLSEHNITLEKTGGAKELDAVLAPKFAYNNKVIWQSSNSGVAAVSENGIVTPVKEGTATITAALADGSLSDSCNVTVIEAQNEKVTLDTDSITLKEVDSVYPLHASAENIIWKSDNEKVAVVNDGVVTAVGEGKTKITATDGLTSASCAVSVSVSKNTITNDIFRTDTDGNTIYAQGGCIQKFGDKYYWYGIKYKEGPIYAKNPEKGAAGNAQYEAFTCYSSTDLVNWKFEGYPLNEKAEGWVGRMGVAYNENTKKYVLISQFAPGIIFATADKPTGPFKKDHIFTGELPIEKGGTGDQTVFCDDDGKAYLICASWEGREYMYVIPLRESDFLDFDYDNIKLVHHDENGSYVDERGEIQIRDKKGIEGNCMFKVGGNYYFTGSDLYGWYSSRVYYFKSDSILGDYNKETHLPVIMKGARDGFAHNSQAGFYVTIHGSDSDLVMYCGDRWGGFAGNGKGFNQWVPITMDEDGTPYFNDLHQWKIDAKKGTWEIGEGNNFIRNNEFEDDRHITNNPNGWTTLDNVGGYANSSLRDRIDAGNFVWQQKAAEDYIADISQTIKDLRDGEYVLTAYVKSSGGQNRASLYAQTSEGEYVKSVKTAIDVWTEIVVADNIKVTDGKCTIGLYSDAHADEWVQMDNLRLVKVK